MDAAGVKFAHVVIRLEFHLIALPDPVYIRINDS